MSRGPANFRQRDLTAAVRAVKAAGLGVARIEVEKGRIVITPGQPQPVHPEGQRAEATPEPNEWDSIA